MPGEIADAYVALRFAAENLSRELQRKVQAAVAQIPDANVDVDADTERAESKLEAIARQARSLGRQRPRVKVDVDEGGARRMGSMASSLEGKFSGLTGTMQKFNIQSGALRSGLKLIQFGGIIAAVGPAASGLAAIGSAAVALASSLAPIMSLAPAVGVSLLAMVQGVGIGIAAFKGVGDALKANTQQNDSAARSSAGTGKAAVSSARQQASAAEAIRRAVQNVSEARRDAADAAEQSSRRIADAERGVLRAQEQSQRAQEALTRARAEAREELEDLVLSVEGAALAEERASLRLIQARRREAEMQDLRSIYGDDAKLMEDLRDAGLDLAEADLALRQATERRGDEQERLNETNRTGIEGSAGVVSAARDVASANEGVQDSLRDLADAQRESVQSQEDAATRISEALLAVTAAQQSAASAAEVAGTAGAESFDRFAYAMSKLSAPAQQMVRTLLEFMVPLRALRDIAAASMFPGLEAGLRSVMPVLTAAGPVVAATGAALGEFFRQLGELVASPAFSSELFRLGTQNAGIIGELGKAFLAFLPGLLALANAAAPFALRLAELATHAGNLFSRFMEAKTASGGLASAFETGWDAASRLWGVIEPLAGVLFGLGRAAKETGDLLMDTLGANLDSLSKKVNSVAGQKGIGDYFKAMVPGIMEIARLIGDVAKLFVEFTGGANSGQFASLVQMIRTDFVPAFRELLEKGQELGPVMIGFFSDLIRFISRLPLGVFFEGIGLIMGVLSALVGHPIVQWLLQIAVLFISPAHKILALIAIAGKLSIVFGALGPIFEAVGGFLGNLIGGVVNFIREWGLLFLGPIGVIIKFKDEIWGAIQAVIGFIGGLPGRVGGFLGDVVSIFTGLPNRILEALGNLGQRLYDAGFGAVRRMGDAIKDAIKWVIEKAGELVTDVKKRLFFWESPPEAFGQKVGSRVGRGIAEGLRSARGGATTEADRLIAEIKDRFGGDSPFGALGLGAGGGFRHVEVTNHITTIPQDPQEMAAVLDRETAWAAAS